QAPLTPGSARAPTRLGTGPAGRRGPDLAGGGPGRAVPPRLGQLLHREPDAADSLLVLPQLSLERRVDAVQRALECRDTAVEDRLALGRELEQRRASVLRVRVLADVPPFDQPAQDVALGRSRA